MKIYFNNLKSNTLLIITVKCFVLNNYVENNLLISSQEIIPQLEQ